MSHMTADQRTRTLRIIHIAFLASLVMFIMVGEFLARERSEQPELPPVFLPALAVIGISNAFAAITFRRKAEVAAEALVRNPEDLSLWQRWQGSNIASFALAESIVLFGWILRFMGAELAIAAVFYAAGFVTMLICTPRRPSL